VAAAGEERERGEKNEMRRTVRVSGLMSWTVG
jgi:hypothetical protein